MEKENGLNSLLNNNKKMRIYSHTSGNYVELEASSLSVKIDRLNDKEEVKEIIINLLVIAKSLCIDLNFGLIEFINENYEEIK